MSENIHQEKKHKTKITKYSFVRGFDSLPRLFIRTIAMRIVYFQVANKLAGHATGTAAWATNVGNEHGQVLMSVLTAAEGAGLMEMAAGIQRRYETVGQSSPTLMYVDQDCCSSTGDSAVTWTFCRWPDLAVRLDVWHFIRRFSSACTTDTHPLYSVFLSKMYNVNSVRNKFGPISEVLGENHLKYLAITESKIDNSFPDSKFSVPNCTMYRRDMNQYGWGGGINVYPLRRAKQKAH